jgi:hypothetical protein
MISSFPPRRRAGIDEANTILILFGQGNQQEASTN